jgi:hypothetical protein
MVDSVMLRCKDCYKLPSLQKPEVLAQVLAQMLPMQAVGSLVQIAYTCISYPQCMVSCWPLLTGQGALPG